MIDWSVEPYSVYAIIEDGEITYIGMTWKPQQRLRGHNGPSLIRKGARQCCGLRRSICSVKPVA